jgi:2'-5' RNA ligase
MVTKRQQLTLFIEKKDSEIIESVRQKYNPIQFSLIKSHIALCREDELLDLGRLVQNLENLNSTNLSINFGNVHRFSEGKGVLIPTCGDQQEIYNLRKQILTGIIAAPRIIDAHITLMHPRNSKCTDTIFEQIKKENFPKQIIFKKISLIEQELNKPWSILQDFKINKS